MEEGSRIWMEGRSRFTKRSFDERRSQAGAWERDREITVSSPTASPRSPKQWHMKMKSEEKAFRALPFRGLHYCLIVFQGGVRSELGPGCYLLAIQGKKTFFGTPTGAFRTYHL